jgi:putative transposase
MSLPRQVVEGRFYLVTRRCTQRQFLLRPDEETNNAFVYCLAHAANNAGLHVVAFIANSNHYHAVVLDAAGCIPKFLEAFHKLLAKHQNALRGRWENFWASEQTSLVELVGPDDILAKTVYTLTNPVKDFLVERAREWPGATSLAATLGDEIVVAKRPRRFFRANGKMPKSVELRCGVPPKLEHLLPAQFHDSLADAIDDAETKIAAERARTGRRVLGRQAVLAQDPFACPESREPRRGLDPKIASQNRELRAEAIRGLKTFHAAHRNSLEAWLAGEPVVFPYGTWKLRVFASVNGAPSISTA